MSQSPDLDPTQILWKDFKQAERNQAKSLILKMNGLKHYSNGLI